MEVINSKDLRKCSRLQIPIPRSLSFATSTKTSDYTVVQFIVLAGLSMALSAAISVAAAAEPWKWLQPQPHGNRLLAAATDGTTMVAVGDHGTIMTKPASGTSWQLIDTSSFRPTQSQQMFLDTPSNIVWTGQRFIISGYFKEGLLASTNGLDWSVIPRTSRLGVIEFDEERSLAVPLTRKGAVILGILTSTVFFPGDRAAFIRSTDHGQTWQQGWLPQIPKRTGFRFDNAAYTTLATHKDLFVVGGANGMIATSPDGLKWEPRGKDLTSALVMHLASNGQALVASTFDDLADFDHTNDIYELLHSTDGIIWSKVNLKPILDQLKAINPEANMGIGSVFADGNRFFVKITGRWFVSQNGLVWNMLEDDLSLTSSGFVTWMGALGNKTYFLNESGTIGRINIAQQDQSKPVVQSIELEAGGSDSDQYFGQDLSAAGLDNITVLVSGAGTTYTTIQANNLPTVRQFVNGFSPRSVWRIGDHLIIAASSGSSLDSSSYSFFRSLDGLTWELVGDGSFEGNALELDIAGGSSDNGPLLMATSETNFDFETQKSTTTLRLYRSTQGMNGWQPIAVPGNTNPIIAADAGAVPSSSLDPAVEWDGQRFILKTTAGELWQSPDGSAWQKIGLPRDSRNFLHATARFFAEIDDSRGELENNYAAQFVSNGEKLVVRPAKLRYDKSDLIDSDDGRWFWSEWGPEVYFVFDFSKKTWSRVVNPPLDARYGEYREVVWTGTNFVTATKGSGLLSTSPDGINWTRRKIAADLQNLYMAGPRLIASNCRGGILTHPDGISPEAFEEKNKWSEFGLDFFLTAFDRAMHVYEITNEGQALVDEAVLLKNTSGSPLSFAELARMVGGLMAFYFEDEPIPVPLPATPEMTVERAGRSATLWFPDFNLRSGVFLGVRRIQFDLNDGTVKALPTLPAAQMSAILAAEMRLDADFNADGVVGDAINQDLGAGLYSTASGALYYSVSPQTIGRPVQNAFMLRDTRGTPIAANAFLTGFNTMQQAGSSPASLVSGDTLRIAVPNFSMPRGSNTRVFANLTIYSFNFQEGSPNRGRMLSAPQIQTPARNLAALRLAETNFNSDFDRDGVIGDRIERHLGGGLYVTASGALYHSVQSLSISQPAGPSALLLSSGSGNPQVAASFAPNNQLLGLTTARSASLESGSILKVAIPRFNMQTRNRVIGMSPTNQPSLPRFNHSQIWTGEKLIVWGGSKWIDHQQGTTEVYGDGGIYDPRTDRWTPISSNQAPSARAGHTAVWTGSKMIVWGGSGAKTADSNDMSWEKFSDGGIYDPARDRWEPINEENAPTPRSGHTAVWTGNKMIVWGGVSETGGAIYDPQNNAWSTLSTFNAPQPKVGHGTVWTGDRMAIWGGSEESGGSQGSGAFYDLSSWESVETDANTPWGGEGRSAENGERAVELLWTGSKLLAVPINSYDPATDRWFHKGGAYDPVARSWGTIMTTGAPNIRPYMAALTREDRLFVGGSRNNNFAGLMYDFGRKRWSTVMSSATGSFQGRQGTWASKRDELLVFGGMWANTPFQFSGGPNGNRGFRLQLNTPVFTSLSVHEFNSSTGRLLRSSTLPARQTVAIRRAETEFGTDFDGDGVVSQSAP